MHESFLACAAVKPSFTPELEACAELISILDERGIDHDSLRAMISAMNRVSAGDHYNGSAWFDLQNQLAATCAEHGLSARVRPGGSHAADAGISVHED